MQTIRIQGQRQRRCFARLVRRFRWWVAAPILRPIVKEWRDVSRNAHDCAQQKGQNKDWRIECITRSEIYDCHASEVEQAFGCWEFGDDFTVKENYK